MQSSFYVTNAEGIILVTSSVMVVSFIVILWLLHAVVKISGMRVCFNFTFIPLNYSRT